MEKKYLEFVKELKQNIIQSRYIAARLANKEQLLLYFKIGKMLSEKIANEKWGANVLQQISEELKKQVPALRGFSYRNLRNMRQFFEKYKGTQIWQSVAAKLQNIDTQRFEKSPSLTGQFEVSELEDFFGISFTHHILLLNKCKTIKECCFYIFQAASQYWSVSVLENQIEGGLYEKQGKLPNNFNSTLPEEIKPIALEVFMDEYLMDFLNLEENSDERKVEAEIVANIKHFILRMGKGFSFIGNQYRIELDGEEFFIDLLFFNRHLRSLVIFELKRGKFQPEYVGKLNFYLNVLDEKIKLPHENSSIGIILCKEKNNTVVEFSIRSIDKAIGTAIYKTTKDVPKEMKGILPNTDELTNLF